jgi:DNA invertase Pin-like site-specific DNA recombinase
VNRLGRSLQDLVGFLSELHGAGVDLSLHQQALDTTTPSGRPMFGTLGVFAEFERSMIQARLRSGLDRARAQGTKSGKAIGRPRTSAATEKAIQRALSVPERKGIRAIAREFKVGTGTVQRIAEQLGQLAG